jgi:hypothetical protein
MRGLPTLVRRLPGALVLSAALAVVVAAMMGSGVDRPALQPAASGGAGYWLVTSEGAVSAFGDAVAAGSLASAPARPVRGMAPTPSGIGYWLVASDGGLFAFGDAGFYGSTGAIKLNKPIEGMAATPSGRGYWLVASDGGLFAFGDA